MTPAPRDLAGIAGLHRRTRARITGTIVGLYDARRAGIEVEPTTPWATVCEDHSTSVCHETRGLASKAMADPSSWCDSCRNGIAAGTPALRVKARALAKRLAPWSEAEINPNSGLPEIAYVEDHPAGSAEEKDELGLLLSRIFLYEDEGGPEPTRPPTGEEVLETPALEAEVAMVEARLVEVRAEVRELEEALARKRAILAKRA